MGFPDSLMELVQSFWIMEERFLFLFSEASRTLGKGFLLQEAAPLGNGFRETSFSPQEGKVKAVNPWIYYGAYEARFAVGRHARLGCLKQMKGPAKGLQLRGRVNLLGNEPKT